MSICYPPDTDWSCRFTEDQLLEYKSTPEGALAIEKSEAFAWSLLAALTAYQIGTCPVTVRPCAKRCEPQGGFLVAPVGRGGATGLPSTAIGRFQPFISGGNWYNACGCTGGDCSCSALSEVILPGPVGAIVEVRLDGEVIPASAYRVDNSNRLLRKDGGTWPACQDMTLSDADGFSVTYYRGARPNIMTRAAAGELANEFLLSCEGGECRLPANVTRASRGGESYEFSPQDFQGGDTGIPEVNAVIRIYNPYGLKSRPTVTSPDVHSTRVSTWS